MKKAPKKYWIYPVCVGLALTIVFMRLVSVQILHGTHSGVITAKPGIQAARTLTHAGLHRVRGMLRRLRILS